MRFIFCNKLVYNDLGVKDQIETDAVSGDTYGSFLNRLYVATWINKLSYRSKLFFVNNAAVFNISSYTEQAVYYTRTTVNSAECVIDSVVLQPGSESMWIRCAISSNGTVTWYNYTTRTLPTAYSKVITIYSV